MDLYQKYSHLLETSTQSGLYEFDYETDMMIWSPQMFDIFDCDPVVYHPCLEAHSGFFLPTSLEALFKHIAYLESIQKPSTITVQVRTPRGRNKTLRLSLHGEFIEQQIIKRYGTVTDITEVYREKIENDFFQERVQLALQVSGTGTWDYDVLSDSLFWDDSMFVIFDIVTQHEISSFRDWIDLIHPEDRDMFIDHFNKGSKGLADSNAISLTCRILTALGRIAYIKVNAKFYIDESNRNTRILGTCVDTTDSELIQQKIVQQATIAQQNMIKAQDASETQKRFLANMSHEIRTPLNTMMGALQILQTYHLDSKSTELVHMAFDSSSELLRLINDILVLSKIDAHEMAIEHIDLNIEHLVRSAIAKFSLIKSPDVSLCLDIAPDFETRRVGDPIRFNQILNNLLSNALKFTLEGTITVAIRGDVDNIELAVKDTGIGIAHDKLDTIFQAFKQADDSTTRHFGGTGLGLAICHSLAELMNARLSVKSKVGVGSTFTFSVPMPINIIEASPFITRPTTTPSLSGKRILIAEDNPSNQKVLTLMLESTQADLTIVDDGQALVDIFTSDQEFDVIMLDLHMPLLDGEDACKQIRNIDTVIPIFALTADVHADNNKTMLSIGFDEVITKPIDKLTLFAHLTNYCLDEVELDA
ncbi:MAG: ATP-binding protein [Glaciecola sp.]|jgi:signal transduction histidine kinase/CheY-like chemotaxis protein